MTTSDVALRLAIAALGGAVVGVERQWSGHADGPDARFAGIRTFTLIGLVGGAAGVLASDGQPALAVVLATAAAALVVAAYAAASRRDVDGTTEVAALAVLAAGLLSGLDRTALASGLAALTGVLLVEKSRLHAFAGRLDAVDVRSGLRFAAMALVVLPLLPAGPFGPAPGVRPRELWALVLFFSGLGFAGHVARRALGPRHAVPVAGALGGLLSSTQVTLTYARTSRSDRAGAATLGLGAIAANLMLFPRVLLVSAALDRGVAAALVPWLAGPAAVAALAALVGLRRTHGETPRDESTGNPLRVGAALQMAALFQVVLFAVELARQAFGAAGIYGSAAVLGLTDVDALTLSMARRVGAEAGVEIAARAIAIGVLANTCLKLGISLAVGAGSYRVAAGGPLALMAVVLGAALWMW